MPANDRIGLDEHKGLAPFGPEPGKDYPQDPIRSPKPESPSIASLQNAKLAAESQNLHL
jgi:hypothetical protein